jgi:NADPH2:quinone reductase
MMREGIHPETPRLPFTPGWDLVGVVDALGAVGAVGGVGRPGGVGGVGSIGGDAAGAGSGLVSGPEPGQLVAALPIHGAYAEHVCLPVRELVPVPNGVDPAEAVSLVLNYVTAYQMLHHSAKIEPRQRVLIHGAAGGVGTALLQLGLLVGGLEMYGTCSARGASTVSELGAVPIDYQHADFVTEIRRATGDGVDAVFDGIGGRNIWRSRMALRRGGRVVAYGITSSLSGGRSSSSNGSGDRHRFRAIAGFGGYIAASWLLPGRKRVVPYSIQTLKRIDPGSFRRDLSVLLGLLRDRKIRPVIARRFPLMEARSAHEMLGRGGVVGKIVLVQDAPG